MFQIRILVDELRTLDQRSLISKLGKEELTSKVKIVTGLASDNRILEYIVGTFNELCKLADFENKMKVEEKVKDEEIEKTSMDETKTSPLSKKLGISYTINLNLPATTEIEVFNAIFKSLKEHILND